MIWAAIVGPKLLILRGLVPQKVENYLPKLVRAETDKLRNLTLLLLHLLLLPRRHLPPLKKGMASLKTGMTLKVVMMMMIKGNGRRVKRNAYITFSYSLSGSSMPDSMCSSGTLGEKAGRLVIRVKRKIKKKDKGEESLKVYALKLT